MKADAKNALGDNVLDLMEGTKKRNYSEAAEGAFGKFHEKTSIFSKVESDPRIQLSKSGTFRKISLGFYLPNGFGIFGGSRNRTTDNSKN